MKFADANKLDRKSGVRFGERGHPSYSIASDAGGGNRGSLGMTRGRVALHLGMCGDGWTEPSDLISFGRELASLKYFYFIRETWR
jgi:hypothetical protein